MKKILTILLAAFLCADVATAQPAARRREQAQQQQQKDQGRVCVRRYLFQHRKQWTRM